MTDKRAELLELINASGQWAAPGEFAQVLKISGVSTNGHLRALTDEGKIQCMVPPRGFGTGIKKIYARLGVAPPEGARPRSAEPAVKPPVTKRKVRRAKHAKRKKHVRAASAVKAAAPRWALTSDGAFVDLTDSTEISKAKARALVDFVRVLDAGEA
jgi:hypothetical protein